VVKYVDGAEVREATIIATKAKRATKSKLATNPETVLNVLRLTTIWLRRIDCLASSLKLGKVLGTCC
jgi:hypothetical protein